MTRERALVIVGLICTVVAVGIVIWVLKASVVNHWLAVHTGTVNEPGPYYGFWSGFGSDLAEFGIIGAIATAVYQIVKKFNCHEPGCWPVGNHAAAGGQFYLCYHHHPDYKGRKPNAELIARLHREHIERQEVIHAKLREVHEQLGEHIAQRSGGLATSDASLPDVVPAPEGSPGRSATD
jgi:hypothetical protein